jgi:hypothetical protein
LPKTSWLLKKPPLWRICLLAVIIGVGCAFYSVTLGVVVAVFGFGLGVLLNWAKSSSWARRHAYRLVAIGILANILLLLWKVIDFALHAR